MRRLTEREFSLANQLNDQKMSIVGMIRGLARSIDCLDTPEARTAAILYEAAAGLISQIDYRHWASIAKALDELQAKKEAETAGKEVTG